MSNKPKKEKIIKIKGNYNLALSEAEAFFEAACMCETEHFRLDMNSKFLFPFVVNLTFACELYLKSIMIFFSKDCEFVKTHDLLKLFKNLGNDKIKDMLQKSFEERGKDLLIFLEHHKNHFIDFRYAFEDNDKQLSVFSTDLGNFAKCLRKICLEMVKI